MNVIIMHRHLQGRQSCAIEIYVVVLWWWWGRGGEGITAMPKCYPPASRTITLICTLMSHHRKPILHPNWLYAKMFAHLTPPLHKGRVIILCTLCKTHLKWVHSKLHCEWCPSCGFFKHACSMIAVDSDKKRACLSVSGEGVLRFVFHLQPCIFPWIVLAEKGTHF